MEITDRREWEIRELDGDDVVLEPLPGGEACRFGRDHLPGEPRAGDRFTVVAGVDRRGTDAVTRLSGASAETLRDLSRL